jgi:hypothetical protein
LPRLRRSISSELLTMRHILTAFDRSLQRLVPMLSAAMSLNGARKGNGRSSPRLSAKARASLVLQGRYMGYMRQLKPRQKAQVRRIKEAKGVRAAIQMASKLAAV